MMCYSYHCLCSRYCCLPIYRCGGSERLTDFPKVTQQRRGRAMAGDWVRLAGPQPALFGHNRTASREGSAVWEGTRVVPFLPDNGQGLGRCVVRSRVIYAAFSHSQSHSTHGRHSSCLQPRSLGHRKVKLCPRSPSSQWVGSWDLDSGLWI